VWGWDKEAVQKDPDSGRVCKRVEDQLCGMHLGSMGHYHAPWGDNQCFWKKGISELADVADPNKKGTW